MPGGFFARLEGSRKYIQGCASVYGVTNDSAIKGAFLIRGQDAQPAFEVAPDWESYEFTKLDPKSEKDRKFFESMMAWDQPIEVKGKEVRSLTQSCLGVKDFLLTLTSRSTNGQVGKSSFKCQAKLRGLRHGGSLRRVH